MCSLPVTLSLSDIYLNGVCSESNEVHVSNEEVLKRASLPSIQSILLQVQLRWTGHVPRMEDIRMPKAVIFNGYCPNCSVYFLIDVVLPRQSKATNQLL